MGKMFDDNGRLHIPILEKLNQTESKLEVNNSRFIIKKAFCPKGHNLICDTIIDEQKGIKLYFTDINGKRGTEIVLSPIIADNKTITLSGEKLKPGEITKAHCPVCHTELEILHDCECGGFVYVFYLDKSLDRNFGISFCSRIGCIKSSRLRFSKDAIMEYLRDHIL